MSPDSAYDLLLTMPKLGKDPVFVSTHVAATLHLVESRLLKLGGATSFVVEVTSSVEASGGACAAIRCVAGPA